MSNMQLACFAPAIRKSLQFGRWQYSKIKIESGHWLKNSEIKVIN